MFRFSIIIPNYNEEKYISRCLESIFNQTINKKKYEVIVIDDGSTDNSTEIIKKYNVKLLYSNRLGTGGARNKGLEIAKGEYIILLDGDDYLYKNDVLERLDKELNNEDIVFVKYKQVLGNQEKQIEENKAYTLGEQIYKSCYFCCTLKCFKKQLTEGVRYKDRSYHEDIAFTLELMCKANSFLYFDDIMYIYYKEENTSTVDNYNVRKALDFTIQTLEYLYLADKYKDKKEFIIKRIEQSKYESKISKLIDWVKNDRSYTYKEFLNK